MGLAVYDSIGERTRHYLEAMTAGRPGVMDVLKRKGTSGETAGINDFGSALKGDGTDLNYTAKLCTTHNAVVRDMGTILDNAVRTWAPASRLPRGTSPMPGPCWRTRSTPPRTLPDSRSGVPLRRDCGECVVGVLGGSVRAAWPRESVGPMAGGVDECVEVVS